jgi:hypothetical protein
MEHDITIAGAATIGAWAASIATTVFDGTALGAVSLAFSGALSMLWLAQRRQRRMLVESMELARTDRDECRRELHELKDWIAHNLESR